MRWCIMSSKTSPLNTRVSVAAAAPRNIPQERRGFNKHVLQLGPEPDNWAWARNSPAASLARHHPNLKAPSTCQQTNVKGTREKSFGKIQTNFKIIILILCLLNRLVCVCRIMTTNILCPMLFKKLIIFPINLILVLLWKIYMEMPLVSTTYFKREVGAPEPKPSSEVTDCRWEPTHRPKGLDVAPLSALTAFSLLSSSLTNHLSVSQMHKNTSCWHFAFSSLLVSNAVQFSIHSPHWQWAQMSSLALHPK